MILEFKTFIVVVMAYSLIILILLIIQTVRNLLLSRKVDWLETRLDQADNEEAVRPKKPRVLVLPGDENSEYLKNLIKDKVNGDK